MIHRNVAYILYLSATPRNNADSLLVTTLIPLPAMRTNFDLFVYYVSSNVYTHTHHTEVIPSVGQGFFYYEKI